MKLLAQTPIDIGSFKGPGVGIFDPGYGLSGVTAKSAAWSLESILSNVIGFLTVIAGLAFLMYFVFGALQWTLAGGDEGKVDSAKKQMTNGAIGLIIIIIAYGVIAVVGGVLGLNILDPGCELQKLNPIAGPSPC